MIYEQDSLRKCNISTLCNYFICVLLKRQKQNLLCKTGGRVVNKLILDKIFKIGKQTLFLYSSIEYMFVKPSLKRFEINTKQL